MKSRLKPQPAILSVHSRRGRGLLERCNMLDMKFMTSGRESVDVDAGLHEDPQSSTNAPQSAGSLSNPEQVIGIK